MNKNGFPAMLDKFAIQTGHITAWLTLVMVLAAFAIVVLRYVFGVGAIWLQETLVWMHAAVFMLGAAYTLQVDGHVRVDVFYREMSDKRKAWVNLLGVLFFLYPLCGFFVYESFAYIVDSWTFGEISRNAGGMPYPAIPLLKSALILMPITVALQGLAMLLKSISTIGRH